MLSEKLSFLNYPRTLYAGILGPLAISMLFSGCTPAHGTREGVSVTSGGVEQDRTGQGSVSDRRFGKTDKCSFSVTVDSKGAMVYETPYNPHTIIDLDSNRRGVQGLKAGADTTGTGWMETGDDGNGVAKNTRQVWIRVNLPGINKSAWAKDNALVTRSEGGGALPVGWGVKCNVGGSGVPHG